MSVRTKAVTIVAIVILGPLMVIGVPVLTMEWFGGQGPAWWHWLRGEKRRV